MGLFKPAWMNKNEKKALIAVKKLTDQARIARAAQEGSSNIRLAAIKKLVDQKLLAGIAKDAVELFNNNYYNIIIVIEKLTDQGALYDVAKNARHIDMRCAAVEKLMDQGVLTDFAKNDENDEVRFIAAKKLIDKTLAQEIYIDIAQNGEPLEVRINAAGELTNQNLAQEIYANIASYVNNDYHREMLFERLKDKNVFIERCCNKGNHLWFYKADTAQRGDFYDVDEFRVCKVCGKKEYSGSYSRKA